MSATIDNRQQRQAAIREILAEAPIARQAELVRRLRERGIAATQSSVSRDLRELGVAKHAQGYAAAPVDLSDTQRLVPGDFVRGIASAGANLTVIRTAVGAASRVAVYLDRADWPEIVGTLSGDDTVFVATASARAQQRLQAKLRAQFSGGIE